MLQKYIISFILFFSLLITPTLANAQQESYNTGEILNIETQNNITELNVNITSGQEKDTTIIMSYPEEEFKNLSNSYKKNDTIILTSHNQNSNPFYLIHDTYRLPSLLIIFIIFVLVIVGFGKIHGLRSIAGLLFSIAVISLFIVPQLLKGHSPLTISIIGALIIATVSMYLSHGFNKKTSVALLSTIITFTLGCILSIIFVNLASLSGLGTEEAAFLIGDSTKQLNLKGLLLAGIIIGTLGVLDDITTSQTAAVNEIYRANPALSFNELYSRGTLVGKEHIISLVNTLALAYAGASLPLFLLFAINTSTPFWVALNSEFIAEELVRTFVGSIALILAVPISTLCASYFILKQKQPLTGTGGHTHIH